MTQYWGGTKHFFSPILYNFKNIGGHVPPSPPYSAVLAKRLTSAINSNYFLVADWSETRNPGCD